MANFKTPYKVNGCRYPFKVIEDASSMTLLFQYSTFLQNDTHVTSRCTAVLFGGQVGNYRSDQRFPTCAEKERWREGKTIWRTLK